MDRLLAHEIAHYYWANQEWWLNEGMASTIEARHNHAVHGAIDELTDYSCSKHPNIQDLEHTRIIPGSESLFCSYSLGERLFQSLRAVLGDQVIDDN